MDYTIAPKVESRIFDTVKKYSELRGLCFEARQAGFYSVQIFPCQIDMAKEVLEGSDVKINALISYPHGGFTAEQKAAEAADAVEHGAEIVEVMINTRHAKDCDYDYIYNEMKAVRDAVPNAEVIFIVEIECLLDNEIECVCKAAVDSGIDMLSTSAGIHWGLDKDRNDVMLVASVEEVEQLLRLTEGKVRVQAEGFVRTREVAEKLLAAGADRVSSETAFELIRG